MCWQAVTLKIAAAAAAIIGHNVVGLIADVLSRCVLMHNSIQITNLVVKGASSIHTEGRILLRSDRWV